MGWNEITATRNCPLLTGIGDHPYLYFAHSYYVPETEVTAATCTYTLPYTAVLHSNNIFGVQFHRRSPDPRG